MCYIAPCARCKTVPRNIDDVDRLRLAGIVLNSAAPHDVIQYTPMHVAEKILKVAGKTLLYSFDGKRGRVNGDCPW
jgi:hypothetical protein